MSDNPDERWPDLPPNATPEQIIQRGRELQKAYTEHKDRLKEHEKLIEEAIERAQADGTAESEEGAALIAHLKEEIAAIKVLHASWGERQELGRETAREKGYDV